MKTQLQRQLTMLLTLSLLLIVAVTNLIQPVAAQGSSQHKPGSNAFRSPKIAAGEVHNLALKSDGTVVAWGYNSHGQTNVPAGLSAVTAVAAGVRHSLALKSDGTVVAWGGNFYGDVPAGLSGVTAIAAGYFHSLALKSDGTVVAWGNNDYGQTNVPAGLSGVTAIDASDNYSLALKSDGTVVAWGINDHQQTNIPAGLSGVTAIAAGAYQCLALKSDGTVVVWGNDGFEDPNFPTGLNGVTAIAAGLSHALALKSDGTIVAWGNNIYGQTNVPAGLSGVTAIAVGSLHNLALRSDGSAVAWGDNTFGQTTIPSSLTTSSNRAVAWGNNGNKQTDVPANLSGVTALTGGLYQCLALKSDGTVVVWGNDGFEDPNFPTGLSGVKAIAAGYQHVLALKSDGTIVAWGNNVDGQATVPGAAQSGVTAIAAGSSHSLALKSDGSVIAWGRNIEGQTTVPSAAQSNVTAIAAGGNYSLALKSDGTVVAWGSNNHGQRTVPSAAQSGVIAIAAGAGHSLALKSDGTVVAWGWNNDGQTNVPANLSGVTTIAAGLYHNLALKSDGSVVAWGSNAIGETMVPSAAQSGVTAIAASANYSLALRVSNTPSTITVLNGLAYTAGSPASNSLLATVSDLEDVETALTIQATPLSGSGVTLSNFSVDASGNVTADVQAACDAITSTFTLRVIDSGGLFAETILTVTVTPDTILTSTPAIVSGTDVSFSFSGANNCALSSFECQLDNGGWTACASPQSYSGLAIGPHTFQVRAKDAAGNVDPTPATYSWQVFVASCGTVVNPATLVQASLAIPYAQSFSASPSGSYSFSLLAGTLPPGLQLANVAGVYTLKGTPTTPGTYTFAIKAKKNNSTCEGMRIYTMVIAPTVVPKVNCLIQHANGSYTVWFGYDNSTGAPVTIPVGADNYFTSGAADRGQTTVFQPGVVTNAFSVTFANAGAFTGWSLKGPDGKLRGVVPSVLTPSCP